jgi:hypothetical protein
MRIIDFYIGRFAHHSMTTTFTTLAVFVSGSVGAVIKFIEQGKTS